MSGSLHIALDSTNSRSSCRDAPAKIACHLPAPTSVKTHPGGRGLGAEDALIYFVGAATTILEWNGVRILTDPNFLHVGAYLPHGAQAPITRITNPAVDLAQLPPIDLCLVSHPHCDHFDPKTEASLRRDLPIVTNQHVKDGLTSKQRAEDNFTAVTALETWGSVLISTTSSSASDMAKAIRITATPAAKHADNGPKSSVEYMNQLRAAMSLPVNGYILELGHAQQGAELDVQYTIYFSGDTVMIDELKEIPKRFPKIDLMLEHLGGAKLPSPSPPNLMISMDAEQGVEFMNLIRPGVTIPVYYDDYEFCTSSLQDFKDAVGKAGLSSELVCLDRGDAYKFSAKR